MKTIKQFLKESILRHIAIKLSDEDYIYEAYGEYDGCKELADYICNKIDFSKDKFNIKVKYDDVKDISNVIFDELEVEFDSNDNIGSGYNPTKTKPLNKNKRFGYAYIQNGLEVKLVVDQESYGSNPTTPQFYVWDPKSSSKDTLALSSGISPMRR